MTLKHASILVIDDDPDVLTAVRILLKPEVKEVITEKNPDNIPALLKAQTFNLIMLDMNFRAPVNTGNEGLFWLRKIKSINAEVPVIMITAYGDIDLAVKSLKEGAADFMVKPWHNEKLLETIAEIVKKEKISGTISDRINNIAGTELVGRSEEMCDIFYKIEKIAPTDANVLLLGENGTGKDLIAKAIHQKSQRAARPYIKVDMGSLSESLFESELFGHTKGSFTGAHESRIGRFEAADKGTLFLDEIGNISLSQQTKLLSALQNRQITPIGSNTSTDIDIRLICATNVPIERLTNEERFRKDLLYRIHTVAITVPPLRRRREDVPLLAKHFTKMYAHKYLKPDIELTDAAMDKLLQHAFPGNVRELQYTIERAVIMANTSVLEADDVIFSSLESGNKNDIKLTETNLNSVEKHTILHVIEKHHGNITKAAKELGITRTALYRRLNKYEI